MEIATSDERTFPMKRLSLLCVLAFTLSTVAMANIIPTTPGPTPIGSNFLWAYNFAVSADQNVNSGPVPSVNPVDPLNLTPGGFVTIYDFQGYVVGSCVGPAGWTCVAQNIGFTPSDTLPPDGSSIVNLTWVYTTGWTIDWPVIVNGFSAVSIYGLEQQVSFPSRGWRNQGIQIGTVTDNVGKTTGPPPIPEPATL